MHGDCSQAQDNDEPERNLSQLGYFHRRLQLSCLFGEMGYGPIKTSAFLMKGLLVIGGLAWVPRRHVTNTT